MEAECPRVILKGFYTQNRDIPGFPVKEAEGIYQLSTFHRALILIKHKIRITHLFQFNYHISKRRFCKSFQWEKKAIQRYTDKVRMHHTCTGKTIIHLMCPSIVWSEIKSNKTMQTYASEFTNFGYKQIVYWLEIKNHLEQLLRS